MVLDGVCQDVGGLFKLGGRVGQLDQGGLRRVPKAFPAAEVGVDAPGEERVEITEEIRNAPIVVYDDKVVMVAHGTSSNDADVVLRAAQPRMYP